MSSCRSCVYLIVAGVFFASGLAYALDNKAFDKEYGEGPASQSLVIDANDLPLKERDLERPNVLEPNSTELNSEQQNCQIASNIKQLISLHNQARLQGLKCGNTKMPKVDELTLSCELSQAALLHAREMSQLNYLKHVSQSGSSFGERARYANYDWRRVAENIASGFKTAEAVSNAWLGSEGHCANILSAEYLDIGAAEVDAYWVVMFGRKK